MCTDCNDSLQINLPSTSVTGATGPQGPAGPAGATGATGPAGTNGANGLDGAYGGVSFPYKFANYSLSGNPGTGYFSFGSANFPDTVLIYISKTDDDGSSLGNLLALLGTSTNTNPKSIIKFFNKTEPSIFTAYRISSISDSGTYYTLNVSILAYSTALFTASSDCLVSFSVAGDKGDTGPQGNPGEFIIGSINPGGATISYPAVASFGEAYRLLSNGIVTDGANSTRVFTNDVIYCHSDSTVADASKWFIWVGSPRAFKPGSGTDAFVHNTASVTASATAEGAIALGDTQCSGDYALSGGDNGTTVSGDYAFGFGSNCQASGQSSVAIGQGCTASASGAVALGLGNSATADTAVALGYTTLVQSAYAQAIGTDATIQAGATYSVVTGGRHALASTGILYQHLKGVAPLGTIPNAEVIGANSTTVTTDRGKLQLIKVPLAGETAGAGAAVNLKPYFEYSGTTYTFPVPNSSIWKCKAEVISVINTGANVGDAKTWVADFVLEKDSGGTLSLKGGATGILVIDNTGAITAEAASSNLTARSSDAANGSNLQIIITSNNLAFSAVADPTAGEDCTWMGKLEITQLTWV